MIICPNCNYQEKDNSSDFCQKCGSKFSKSSSLPKLLTEKESFKNSDNQSKKNVEIHKKNDIKINLIMIVTIITTFIIFSLSYVVSFPYSDYIGIISFFALVLFFLISVKVLFEKNNLDDAKKGKKENNTDVHKAGLMISSLYRQ